MITSLTVTGFKSIRSIENLALGPVNVLIGPNGAGKSNLLSVFQTLQLLFQKGGLREFTGKSGGANKLLHDGFMVTEFMHLKFTFIYREEEISYDVGLSWVGGDELFISSEMYWFVDENKNNISNNTYMIRAINDSIFDNSPVWYYENLILEFINNVKFFQINNTSAKSLMRVKHSENETLALDSDGANIASMLYLLKQHEPRYYRRYVETLQIVWPQLSDFVLEPEYGSLLLRWRERGSEQTFGADQASDGTLRLMALLFVLMQPKARRPKVLILDEPELGLHPAAIRLVAERVAAAAEEGTQVILATQSPLFLDHFTDDQVVVLDRVGRETTARRLLAEELREWREEYSLAELWEKNILGGYPH